MIQFSRFYVHFEVPNLNLVTKNCRFVHFFVYFVAIAMIKHCLTLMVLFKKVKIHFNKIQGK